MPASLLFRKKSFVKRSSQSLVPPTFPRIALKRSKQSLAFRNGNPLVFTRAILDGGSSPSSSSSSPKRQEREGLELGDLVEVVVEASSSSSSPFSRSSNADGSFESLGFGVYNPRSLYRIRILCHRYLHPSLYRQLQQIGNGDDAASPEDVRPPEGRNSTRGSCCGAGIAAILVHHLEVALSKRAALGLPKAGVTDTFRWVNGEGDSLSGLAIDVLGLKAEPIAEGERARASSELLCRGDGEESAMGPVAVVMSSAGWCQVHRTTVMRAIEACLEPITVRNGQPRVRVVWKTTSSRLVQDGYTVENDAGEESDTEKVLPKQLPLLDPDEESKGSVADTTEQDASKSTLQNRDLSSLSLVVRENCVLYNVSPWSNGQKTSVYCDQRDNRLMLAEMCHGKRVLDLCCYHGGFTLNAVLNGGAESCTAVDSSQDAIRALQANLSLNRVGADKVETVCSDITTFLQQSCHGNSRRWYDVVVLDPPKLAPTSSGLEKARRKYHGLNRDAIKAIEPTRGGLLLTCTCSAAMSQRDGGRYFLDMVSGAALAAGRCVTLLRVSGAASCHVQSPVAYPAGAYLSAALFYVHPK